MAFPPCPENLKAIAHYLKVADEHDNRDLVISYWCRIHALDIAIQIAHPRTPEANKLLVSIMEWLEHTKAQNANNEGITSKICAQATVENYALKLFKYADEQDRAENYGKNVVKAFYTAGILMDVLSSFGELSEDVAEKRKYAKWKAAYIHNCLKSGERPVPGPIDNNENDDFTPTNPDATQNVTNNFPVFPNSPANNTPNIGGPASWNMFPTPSAGPSTPYMPPSASAAPYTPPAVPPNPTPSPAPALTPTSGPDNSSLDPEMITKAQKYCKWASSALTYDDVNNAIDNLQKALQLLQTGKNSPE